MKALLKAPSLRAPKLLISSFAYLILFVLGCKGPSAVSTRTSKTPEAFVIAFGSCNRVDQPNLFWESIRLKEPALWIWGGDNIYADTEDMSAMKAMYAEQQAVPEYAALTREVPVVGTWDDHDYGKNDGGREFALKAQSQQLLLDFLGVDKNNPRRQREGVYSAHSYWSQGKEIKVLVLDTRYFRSPLTKGSGQKRYGPDQSEGQDMLGEAQWNWLENELQQSKAAFHVIVSSIQFISNEHGFEKWANMPAELDRMERLIAQSQAKGVFFISGDRHISEFSRKQLEGLDYPLWDFTSSGLTHSYSSFSGEPNPFRVGEVESGKSFGILRIDTNQMKVDFQICGEKGQVLQEFTQFY